MLHNHGVYRDVMSFLGAPDAREIDPEAETWRSVDWFVEQTGRQFRIVARQVSTRRRTRPARRSR